MQKASADMLSPSLHTHVSFYNSWKNQTLTRLKGYRQRFRLSKKQLATIHALPLVLLLKFMITCVCYLHVPERRIVQITIFH